MKKLMKMKRWMAMLLAVVLTTSTLFGDCMTAYAAEMPEGTEATQEDVDSTEESEEME